MPKASSAEPKAKPSWSNPKVALSTMAQVHDFLGDATLLDSFFSRLDEIVTLLDAAPGTSSCNTTLARDMIRLRKVNVLMYGRSGAGKTTLVGTLSNQADSMHQDGEQPVTLEVSSAS